MTKLYVQSSNIYNPVKYSIENAASNAQSGQSVTYSIPSGFSYTDYINGLSDKFKATKLKLNAIDGRIALMERKVNELTQNEINRINLLPDAKVVANNKINL